jgi:hypothetical protein
MMTMVSKMMKERLRTGFGAAFAGVGLLLFVLAFFSAKDTIGISSGPGELLTNLIGLGVMFAVASFLVIRGATMLR